MLAIKYHHLRALIYRPYLRLQDPQDNLFSYPSMEIYRAKIRRNKDTCVAEAQATARLLHNVTHPQYLIQDFPWWQMVPCLLFACSILLFASKFCMDESGGATVADEMQGIYREKEELVDYADTLIMVFKVLGSSKAADSACRMMQEIREMNATAISEYSTASIPSVTDLIE